ncbi:MAG: LysR substrate-binding domain-containing protein [Rhodomicrobium sp.]
MDAADLRVFEAVARLGGMNKAALELNTVQSNVTARIKALEDQLGVAVFYRTNRGVTLTDAGRRLLPYALRVAHLLEDAKRAAIDDGTPGGSLALGSLETTAALRLSPVIQAFAEAYPAVDLSLKTGTSCELIEQVLEHRIEGAFVCGPVHHPDLIVEPFFSENLVILTAPKVTAFEALARAPNFKIIVLRAGCSYRLHLEVILARRGIVNVRYLEFGTLEAIISCVSSGLGVTLLPEALIGSVWREGRVAIHALPRSEGRVETIFIRRRDGFTTSALRAFLQCARPAFAQLLAAE